MFCGSNPCACTAKPKKTVPKVERVRKAPAPTPEKDEVGSPSPAAVWQPDKARPNLVNLERVRDPSIEAEAAAITLFAEADMLHHTSLVELRDRIRLPDYKIDAMIWRQRNDETVRRSE
jgi:hypothetical protein